MAMVRDSNCTMPTLLRMRAHPSRAVVPLPPIGPEEAGPPMNKETAEAVVASLEEVIGPVKAPQAEVTERRDGGGPGRGVAGPWYPRLTAPAHPRRPPMSQANDWNT